MSKFITTGSIVGVVGFLATVAGLFHYSALSAVLSDPATAGNIQATIGLGMSLVSAFMVGNKPAV